MYQIEHNLIRFFQKKVFRTFFNCFVYKQSNVAMDSYNREQRVMRQRPWRGYKGGWRNRLTDSEERDEQQGTP